MPIAMSYCNPHKRLPTHRRRDATAVMSGRFDPLPERDVLTSCLNHIGPYLEVEKDEEERAKRRQERKARDKERKRAAKAEAKAAAKAKELHDAAGHALNGGSSASTPTSAQPVASSSKIFITRPTIHIPAALQRSVSVTPSPPGTPYGDSTPGSTPGPSISSSTSRTSSKRPRTPDDDETLSATPKISVPRKKRIAVKKGWKGWVEGSPPPSEKLINLDEPSLIPGERRTRSGKNFDAIAVGKDSWV